MPRFIINKPVFISSVTIIVGFLLLGGFAPGAAEHFFKAMQGWILERFGWLYILSVAIYFVVVVILAVGRSGAIKLGPDDATPDFSYGSWVSMLFAAGMGIGLMFFAVAEPIMHFSAPPEAAPATIAARREAMLITFFHWGVHAWAIYAVVGLSLAYFGYRYNLPLTIRSGLYPLLKERINGPIGHAVDTFAICGTLFGIATSLGFGVLQINAGLNHLVGLPVSSITQVVLIAVITSIATMSVLSGLDKGVRRLSELNLLVAVCLMLFVLAVGPTAFLMKALVQNIGIYLDHFVAKTFNIYAYEPRGWMEGWTLFHWAWWISWSPFVGMFIARISRGRTVREFVIAVLFVPAGFTFLWMTVFGNTAIFVDSNIAHGALSAAVSDDVAVALFRFFEYLPFSAVSSTIAVALVAIFFVTSSDSGSLVVDTLAAGGATETPALQRLFWCLLEGTVAAILLLAGGLTALQTATIASALPFMVVMLALCFGLFRGMRADLSRHALKIAPAHPAAERSWQTRLTRILHTPRRREVVQFVRERVVPALEEVAAALVAKGQQARVEPGEDGTAVLVVPADGVRDFVYRVETVGHLLPVFAFVDTSGKDAERPRGYEARTFFSDGSVGYDIMGFEKAQIIGDVLTQYERYAALVQSHSSALYVGSPQAS